MEFEFDKIYISHENHPFLKVLFHDTATQRGLMLDGFHFYYAENIGSSTDMKLMDYRCQGINIKCRVVGVKEFEGITFVKLDNEAIFQIYEMGDGENFGYRLAIYDPSHTATTPFGITHYEAVLKNYSEAEDAEIQLH